MRLQKMLYEWQVDINNISKEYIQTELMHDKINDVKGTYVAGYQAALRALLGACVYYKINPEMALTMTKKGVKLTSKQRRK